MSDALVLSLGHNSSAILVRDNHIVCGYETERITETKSDSRFPRLAIEEIHRRHNIGPKTDIFVSHWELFGNVADMSAKHWDGKFLRELFPNGHVYSVNREFTHHDAHAWSSILFVGDNFPSTPEDKSYIFVMDGFGTFGEHMSFYRYVDGKPVLLERKYGFGASLGLLYQYTTAFLGMKQNQDEYKLLAFEAHIQKIQGLDMSLMRKTVDTYANLYLGRISSYMTADPTDPMLSIGALPTVAKEVSDMLQGVLKTLNMENSDEYYRKIVIAYFVQSVVETVVLSKVRDYDPTNLILVGGLFYNVKLNNSIAKLVRGKTSIMPLAGDQGAGLGVYKAINPDLEWPGHLYWGPRSLPQGAFEDDKFIYEDRVDKAFDIIGNELFENEMVNVVWGSMEFGPRALGHTSTIAMPETDIAEAINEMNCRTNEMPFAPMMTRHQAAERLEDVGDIHKSLEYMICTRDFRNREYVTQMVGAAHRYPTGDRFSARPQIVSEPHYVKLLDKFGPLINTSFNFHGVPIVWNSDQVRNTHNLEQMYISEYYKINTIVIPE